MNRVYARAITVEVASNFCISQVYVARRPEISAKKYMLPAILVRFEGQRSSTFRQMSAATLQALAYSCPNRAYFPRGIEFRTKANGASDGRSVDVERAFRTIGSLNAKTCVSAIEIAKNFDSSQARASGREKWPWRLNRLIWFQKHVPFLSPRPQVERDAFGNNSCSLAFEVSTDPRGRQANLGRRFQASKE